MAFGIRELNSWGWFLSPTDCFLGHYEIKDEIEYYGRYSKQFECFYHYVFFYTIDQNLIEGLTTVFCYDSFR